MNENKESEKNWQEKYQQFQYLQEQVENLTQHLQMLSQQGEELTISVNAVKELANINVGNEVLAPIANGIFLKAELKDNQKVIVNVGSGTTVEKSVPEAVLLLEQEQRKMSKQVVHAENFLHELHNKIAKIYQEIGVSQ